MTDTVKLFRRILLGTLFIVFCHIGNAQEWELQGTELHVPLKAEAGEIVAVSNEVIKEVQVQITASSEVKKGFLKYQYKEGDTYPLRRAKSGYDLYYDNKKLIEGKYLGVGINEDDSEDIISVLVSPEGDLVKLKKYKMNEQIIMTDFFRKCNDCYTQELKYVGMQENELLFTYREIIGVLKKVRFEGEFTWSFAPGQMIEYKGLQVKMLKATNSSLEYEIIQGFDALR